MRYFDRTKLGYFSLAQRKNRVDMRGNCDVSWKEVFREEDRLKNDRQERESRDGGPHIPPALEEAMVRIAPQILAARDAGRSCIAAFGAHAIKNGLGPLLGEFIRNRWVSHLATNGAGVIHDWELAFQGQTSEDVRENAGQGKFGLWEETGFNISLALAVGAYEGLGYGEAVGSLIVNQGLSIPSRETLWSILGAPFTADSGIPPGKRGAAADLLELIEEFNIAPGWYAVSHRFPQLSVQAAAYRAGIPFTSHPMFGHDIIYTHRANRGAAIGRTAERDFLAYAESVSNLEGGVYLSVGSAVMSPMIFEKSLSMARNLALREGRDIRDCHIYVVDLQEAHWDWNSGEPPMDNPAYYLRFMKTFNRMGCPLTYISADNCVFFRALYAALRKRDQEFCGCGEC
ncbi:MAG: hypothetical protein LBF77_02905 [Spirochaetaceae bacterium]|nr:hypothetical protein [Spirochaetaceae bacterium]